MNTPGVPCPILTEADDGNPHAANADPEKIPTGVCRRCGLYQFTSESFGVVNCPRCGYDATA